MADIQNTLTVNGGNELDTSANGDIYSDCRTSPLPAEDGSGKSSSPIPDVTDESQKENGSKTTVGKKAKRSETKAADHVLKALSAQPTPQDKLAELCKLYAKLEAENRQLVSASRTTTKKVTTVQKERDTLQNDNNRLILAKDKLETLCRELQKQNKIANEERNLTKKLEEERRKEVMNNFHTTITDIQSQMENQGEKNEKLRQDNRDLTEKLQTIISQFEQREETIQKLLKQKDLEIELHEAKLKQAELLFNQHAEKTTEEKKKLIESLIESKTKQEQMVQVERQMRAQLSMYEEKYTDFQSTLTKSNEVFTTFKSEMDKMSKTIRTLEKENQVFKIRCENTNASLIKMTADKLGQEKTIVELQIKNTRLEKLCRAMQMRSASSEPDKKPVAADNPTNSGDSSQSVKSEETPTGVRPEPTDVRPEPTGEAAEEPTVNNSVIVSDEPTPTVDEKAETQVGTPVSDDKTGSSTESSGEVESSN